jgi:hypothetical protein
MRRSAAARWRTRRRTAPSRDVDELAASVIPAARVSLGVLVREHRALRLEHGAWHEVLACDHLERAALAAELLLEHGGDLGIDY